MMKYLILILVVLISACNSSKDDDTSNNNNTTAQKAAKLTPALSCSALKSTLVQNWVENYLTNPPIFLDDTLELAAGDAAASTEAPASVSQTNTQEANVDEADIIKADSNGNIYIAHYDQLSVVDAFPANTMNEIDNLNLEGYILGLYLDESINRLFAITRPNNSNADTAVSFSNSIVAPSSNQHSVVVIELDISDINNISIVNKIGLSGSYTSTRKVGEKIHLITSQYLNIHDFNDEILSNIQNKFWVALENKDTDSINTLKSEAIEHLNNKIDLSLIHSLLPFYHQNDATQALECEQVLTPSISLSQNQILTVTTINTQNSQVEQTAIIGNGWVTYASENDLYLAQSSDFWWWGFNQAHETAIHHFDISTSQPNYLSTAAVAGSIHNQFSLSHFDGHLRVATTERVNTDNTTTTNHLYILKDNNEGTMDIVGDVGNFANNETIQSARFVNEKAFVVTFEQIDPLFAIDVSDPTKPAIKSELKIPGFSQYIHPIDDNHLLTVGRDGDNTGANNNIVIKLFDVTDLNNIFESFSFIPELDGNYAWSDIAWDHHAINFLPEQGLFSLPINSQNYESYNQSFNGIIVFQYDINLGVSEVFRTDHKELVSQQENQCDNESYYCVDNYYGWMARINRGVFMTSNTDTFIYSLSNIGLKANSLYADTPESNSLLFDVPDSYYHWYY